MRRSGCCFFCLRSDPSRLKTFGCQMNERDSEIMEQMLAQSGYIPVAEQIDADLVILNTCSIRA
ncbi:MAG: hypothetical protein D3907_14835, partial [Candidatus Electrothrix sp. AUS3]|nr:hypothetical protein [Candidatus Electrothrix gigas]